MSKPLAFITGATGGLGVQFARQFAELGYDLALCVRSEQSGKKLSDDLAKEFGVSVQLVLADLATERGMDAAAAWLAKHDVDVCVNNAGLGLFGEEVDTKWSEERGMLEVNVVALTQLSKAAAMRMKQRKKGRILNVASTAAFEPGPTMAAYFASKAYVLSYSVALRNELKPYGVSVTTLCPGPTHTGFQNAAHMEESGLFSGSMQPDTVVKQGIEACLAGKAVFVPGFRNKIATFATRFGSYAFNASIAKKLIE